MAGPTLPAVTHDAAKSVIGRSSVILLKLTGVVGTKSYLVDYVGDGCSVDVGSYMAPGPDNGPAYVADTWEKSFINLWKFRSKEIKKVNTDFGSLAFHKKGTATLIIRDPRDAANKAALVSEEDFPCSIYRDPAEIAHSGDSPSEITIIVQSTKAGKVTLTPDGDTQAPV